MQYGQTKHILETQLTISQSNELRYCNTDLPANPSTYDWTFVKLQNMQSIPYTRVVLDTGSECEDGSVIHAKSDLGIYKGDCTVLPVEDINLSEKDMALRQVARVQCILNGAGEEIGLYKSEFEVLSKVRDIKIGENIKPTLENVKDADRFLLVK
jgi:hypothetical protein